MNRGGQSRSWRATWRLPALVVALLWCAAPMLSAVHSAAEAHRYCVEHGAIEEVEFENDQGEPQRPATDQVRGVDASEPHEACAFAPFCRFGQLVTAFVPEAAGNIGAIPAPTLDDAASVSPVAVVRIAPKTSPPA